MSDQYYKQIQSLQAEVESLKVNKQSLQIRLREVEEKFDTLDTPLWKRILFRVDGWPPWYIVTQRPKWRPWRRWWTS